MKTFVGGNAYVLGVPARDLTDDEWDALPEDLKAAAAPFYEDTPTPPDAPVKESRNGRN